MGRNIDYDPEKVMENITSKYVSAVESLSQNINKLAKELDDCQDKFHCKGSQPNAIKEVYDGFKDVIGEYSGQQGSGSALGGIVGRSAAIYNTAYSEAKIDWDRLQQTNNFKF